MRRWTAWVTLAAAGLIALSILLRPGSHPSLPEPGKEAAPATLASGRVPATPSPAIAAHEPSSVRSVAMNLGEQCLRRHLQAAAKHRKVHWTNRLGFDRELAMGYAQGRLLAAAYPSEALGLAVSWVTQEPVDLDRRSFGFFLLVELARSGSEGAEQALYRLASGTGDPADLALGALHAADPTGKYRSLYLERSRQGSLAAMGAVADAADPEVLSVLGNIERSNPGKEFEPHNRRLAAKDALERLKLLQSPDAGDRLRALVRDPDPSKDHWFDWAVRAASLRAVPGLTDALRERLIVAEKKAEEFRKEFVQDIPRVAAQVPVDNDLESGGADPRYDEVLRAYWRLGGTLNQFQKRRLWSYGYLGDPKERLTELLADQRDK